MPGAPLHETKMGMRFFEVIAPRIADELANLNNNLATLIALLRERLPATNTTTLATARSTQRK